VDARSRAARRANQEMPSDEDSWWNFGWAVALGPVRSLGAFPHTFWRPYVPGGDYDEATPDELQTQLGWRTTWLLIFLAVSWACFHGQNYSVSGIGLASTNPSCYTPTGVPLANDWNAYDIVSAIFLAGAFLCAGVSGFNRAPIKPEEKIFKSREVTTSLFTASVGVFFLALSILFGAGFSQFDAVQNNTYEDCLLGQAPGLFKNAYNTHTPKVWVVWAFKPSPDPAVFAGMFMTLLLMVIYLVQGIDAAFAYQDDGTTNESGWPEALSVRGILLCANSLFWLMMPTNLDMMQMVLYPTLPYQTSGPGSDDSPNSQPYRFAVAGVTFYVAAGVTWASLMWDFIHWVKRATA